MTQRDLFGIERETIDDFVVAHLNMNELFVLALYSQKGKGKGEEREENADVNVRKKEGERSATSR